ncbi:MAG: hypothetical protein EP330_10950 [Deltaproteobacteria bacterium]|nr:MAG: hypothetical protein EP330_10950 [Deltaproteobacteria bacterium]
MLSFTRAGAVATPTTVQIRVTQQFPGRVAAGAPVPQRSLSPEELHANVRHFTVGMRGPRTRPCTALVLSGVALASRAELPQILAEARGWGVDWITVHAGPDEVPSAAAMGADAVAVRLPDVDAASRLAPSDTVAVTAVIPLVRAVLDAPEAVAEAVIRAKPRRVVLTWPFPGGAAGVPPAATEAAAAVHAMLPVLDASGLATGVKGLPACVLGGAERLWRSQNRWYVDAEHQLADALLFFPDVVRFAKEDACRHCAVEAVCDGAPERWLRHGLVGPLDPMDG